MQHLNHHQIPRGGCWSQLDPLLLRGLEHWCLGHAAASHAAPAATSTGLNEGRPPGRSPAGRHLMSSRAAHTTLPSQSSSALCHDGNSSDSHASDSNTLSGGSRRRVGSAVGVGDVLPASVCRASKETLSDSTGYDEDGLRCATAPLTYMSHHQHVCAFIVCLRARVCVLDKCAASTFTQ